jgi:hypothetical protein
VLTVNGLRLGVGHAVLAEGPMTGPRSAPARLDRASNRASPLRCGRACRQRGHRGGMGLHPQGRCLDPTGQQAGRHRRGLDRASTKASPLRCAIVGGPADNADTGAAWVFTRSGHEGDQRIAHGLLHWILCCAGGVWTQQGSK